MADLVFRNASIWGSEHTSLAITGEKITAIGSTEITADTRVIDCGGSSLLPGFVDAHVHTPFAGLELMRIWLHDVETREQYLEVIADHVAAHPGEGWITGGGWAIAAFPGGTPRKEDLDAITGDRPAFLFNRDLHGAWVNSAALRIAGITAATPDPPDGRIERDPDGEPTGTLHEGAAYAMNDHVVPAPDTGQWQEAILAGQAHLHRLGVTSWQDAWVTPATQAAYLGLAEKLVSRVTGCLWWDRHRGCEQIDELLERSTQSGHNFHPRVVKIMVDGTLENYTGALLEPYCCSGDNRGLVYVDADVLNEAVPRLDAAGISLHMHAIGDRAVRMALDAVSRAREANGVTGNRHHIAHLQVIDPADLPRFAALDVTANCQMLWACNDEQMTELTLPYLGAERAGLQYPFATLQRLGTRLAMGSDWPVSSADPLQQMEVGMTRVPVEDRDAEPLLPDERVDLDTCVTAFTAGSAFVGGDDEAGRLEVGARADLVLLGDDISGYPSGRGIGDIPVVTTVVAGQVVHDAG